MAVRSTSRNDETTKALSALLLKLEGKLDADVIALFGPIQSGAEYKVRTALAAVTDAGPLAEQQEGHADIADLVGDPRGSATRECSSASALATQRYFATSSPTSDASNMAKFVGS